MESTLKAMIDKELVVLQEQLEHCGEVAQLYRTIVDSPFSNKLFTTSLDLGIIVLLIVNKHDGMIDRVALSNTELALGAIRASAKPFHDIRIPVDDKVNCIAESVRLQKSIAVDDWKYLFTPALSAVQARQNQTSASIECSIIEPLDIVGGGALIYSFFQPENRLGMDHHIFLTKYANIVAQNLRRLTK